MSGEPTPGTPPHDGAAFGTVARRLVLIFPGFEPLPVEAHMRRFMRESAITAGAFGYRQNVGPAEAEDAADVSVARNAIVVEGAGWDVRDDVVIYGLGDLDPLYSERPQWKRFATGLLSLFDFIVTGTFIRFVRTSWRYGLFFAFPLVMSLLIAVAAILVGWLPANRLGAVHLLWSGPLAVAAASLLVRLADRFAYFLLIMDDWTFARDVARRSKPEIERRLDAVAAHVGRQLATTDADEIVFAAHSFGAVAAVRALAATTGPSCGLLTVGSSLLKVALHPAAEHVRDAAAAIMHADRPWLDVQSLTDPINFYKSDPARDLRLERGRQPLTTRVRFRDQLKPATYAAIKRDIFRVHRQFVYGVERRHSYSFHAILLGPVPFDEVVRERGLPPAFVESEAVRR